MHKNRKNERDSCLQNYTHKIVHSSAMHYQNLIIIHECSKELLKMKNNKSLFWHLVWGGIICFGNFPKGTYVQSQSPCWLVIKNTRQVLHIRGIRGIIIHECSKKLLKMKNSNKKITPSTCVQHRATGDCFRNSLAEKPTRISMIKNESERLKQFHPRTSTDFKSLQFFIIIREYVTTV